jgi:hypothetical protein
VKREAARRISRVFSDGGMPTVPLDTSTQGKPVASTQSKKGPVLPRAQAISSGVPPVETRIPASSSSAALAATSVSR